MGGYLKIYRDIRNHWIYKDPEHFKVWFEMLSCARFNKELKTDTYEGILYTLGFGEFIFGRTSWSKRLGIGERKLRTLVEKLIHEGMISIRRKSAKFTIYFIINYEKYNQQKDQVETVGDVGEGAIGVQQKDQHPSSTRPAPDQQMTTKEEREEGEKENKKDIAPFSEIIDYLNRMCGTNFRASSKATKQHIQARWAEGFVLEDFKRVIDIKSAQWRHDPKMSQYLRPLTIFGPKFESYLNSYTEGGKPSGTHKQSKYAAILSREIPEPKYDPDIF